MDIASIIKAVLTSGEDRSERGIVDLQPGDRLTGKVLRVENDGRVLMDLGGSRALARVGFTVKPGKTLPLQVVENGAVIHLQIDATSTGGKISVPLPTSDFRKALPPSDQERLIGIVRQLMNQSAPLSSKHAMPDNVKNALARVVTLFEPLPVEHSVREISNWVKGAVEDSGLLLEKKLGEVVAENRAVSEPSGENAASVRSTRAIITRDVKSQLLLVRQFLQATADQMPMAEKIDVKSVAFLRHAVDQLLGHIESQQELALPRWADGDAHQVFVHTLHMPNQKNPLKLKVYYPRKKGPSESKGPHRITLLLDMDRLGPLRVDLSMQGKMLQIVFYAAHEKSLDLIGPEVHTVSDSLGGLFDHVAVDCFVSKRKITGFEEEDGRGAGGGRIDLSV